MKAKAFKLGLCALTVVFSMVAAALGYGLMGDAAMSFPVKLACGFVFIMVPLLVIQLVILVF